MQIIKANIYFFILLVAGIIREGFSDSFCQKSKELDSECASYCYGTTKPLLQIAAECYTKDAEITKLKDQLAELKKQKAVWEEKESLCNSLLKMSSDMAAIKSDINQIANQLTKKNDKLDQVNIITKPSNTVATKQHNPNIILLLHSDKHQELKNSTYSDNCENSVGIQTIQVEGISKPFQVFCDNITSDFPWIVMQRRISRAVDFNKNWSMFSNGFGDIEGNYFIGLEKIYRLTKTQPYELYIHLESFKGETGFARYNYFKINSNLYNYQLMELGKFSGNIFNAMSENLNARFSNYERDNDNVYNIKCARMHESAWWFNKCPAFSNLNGRYSDFEIDNAQGIWWKDFSEGHTLKSVKMLIRPVH